ncbi:MAG: PEP-CTERM sorting domain-containing protein [Myxococcota bacterium]
MRCSARHLTLWSGILFLAAMPAGLSKAAPVYWNVFNIEGESAIGAQTVTYDSLADMLGDTNRTGVFDLGTLAPENIVGSGSDGTAYWNVFNIEGESTIGAQTVTYGNLMDMLTDSNRTGVFDLGTFAPENIVGSGSDGTTYWNVFNIEGESTIGAQTVTYDSLADMLGDTNRTGVFDLGAFAPENIVGSGSDGTTYWNLFNIEDESTIGAQTVTYDSLADMLGDTNRTGVFDLGTLAPENIVGSGAAPPVGSPPVGPAIPEPSALLGFSLGLGILFHPRLRARARQRS